MAFLCVGGEHEGITIDKSDVTYTFPVDEIFAKSETYIKIAPKGETPFFMLCGMAPIDAMKRRRELTAPKQEA